MTMETNEMLKNNVELTVENTTGERYISESALIDSNMLKKRSLVECDERLTAGFIY